MSGLFQVFVVAVMVLETLAIGQGADVAKVLGELRAALGGEAVSDVRTIWMEGTRTRVLPDGQQAPEPTRFAMAMEPPGRFARREVMGNVNGMEITRTTGFDGGVLIERTDVPQAPGGGGRMVVQMRPGGMVGGEATPEQIEAQRASALEAARRDFGRIALGMFGTAFDVVPLEFAYAGTAESPDATAHVLSVTGPGGFEARLYVDTASHLPLMLTWMDKEPLRVMMGGPGGERGMTVVQRGGGAVSEQDAARMRQQMQERMREAEANRRVVEFRVFFADYRPFGQLKLPTRLERMVDGEPVERLVVERVLVNEPIDPDFFRSAGR
jgi:hypothetical protein